ncbi:unnamed protein product [Rotaria magnacalcarata]|uniref:Fe2OG dioxygenase domain-containing protein n=4 Tax=Rotaria magnacalcarata TaxID=392030 RepID=A0A820FWY5_9BILA|nr:unnamed protein product [Rotaria magnacalcarata]
MIHLAEKLMESYALALGLTEDYFAPMVNKRAVISRLAYYPPPPFEQNDDQMSCGVHSDQTGVTLLAQLDGTNGLQVKNSLDEWIDAVPIPGTLVVNIGDLIERWSNGHFKATKHRVILRPGQERYSAIAFHMPNYYTKIESCIKGEAPKYVPVITGDFVLKRESLFYGPDEDWVEHEKNVENTEHYFTKIQNSK